jgi:hypothetical protein
MEEIYANTERKRLRVAQEESADTEPKPSTSAATAATNVKPTDMDMYMETATEKKVRKDLAEPNYLKNYQKQPTDLISRQRLK